MEKEVERVEVVWLMMVRSYVQGEGEACAYLQCLMRTLQDADDERVVFILGPACTPQRLCCIIIGSLEASSDFVSRRIMLMGRSE